MNPLTIYQDALNGISQAFRDADFDAYAAAIDLPYLVQTREATLLVTEVEDLRSTFMALVDGIRARGVRHYERVARAADYVARDRIAGWHHTHILGDEGHLLYPHVSHHVIVRREGRWRFSEAVYDMLTASRWPLTEKDLFTHVRPSAVEGKRA